MCKGDHFTVMESSLVAPLQNVLSVTNQYSKTDIGILLNWQHYCFSFSSKAAVSLFLAYFLCFFLMNAAQLCTQFF